MNDRPVPLTPSTPIFSGGKRVGYVSGRVFFKNVDGTRHFLRKPPAIALGCDSLRDAEAAGADLICVVDRVNQRWYWSRIDHLRAHSFRVDRGFGQQLGLTFGYWRDSDESLPMPELSDKPQSPTPQLASGQLLSLPGQD
jgi:hypothetical protein